MYAYLILLHRLISKYAGLHQGINKNRLNSWQHEWNQVKAGSRYNFSSYLQLYRPVLRNVTYFYSFSRTSLGLYELHRDTK